MRLLKILGALFAIVLVAVVAVGGWLAVQAKAFLETAASTEHEERIVEIPRGAGPRKVASLLADQGVVADAERFALFLRWRRAAGSLRAGEFRFFTDQRPGEVLGVLRSAAEVTWPVTLPEGLRIEEMAALVEQAGMGPASRYVELARDRAWIASQSLPLSPPPVNLEGLLVPDTYSFRRGATVDDVVAAQLDRLRAVWDERRVARAKEIGLTPYQVHVLASVVEKETAAQEERPLIARVFHNRLKKGMPLESDPTIIYGLKNYDGTIHKSDVRRPHPWNTYVISGLPPTPIAGPGLTAIDAVLWPADSRALFFVSRNDGTHHFSETYAEHARMVRRYQQGG